MFKQLPVSRSAGEESRGAIGKVQCDDKVHQHVGWTPACARACFQHGRAGRVNAPAVISRPRGQSCVHGKKRRRAREGRFKGVVSRAKTRDKLTDRSRQGAREEDRATAVRALDFELSAQRRRPRLKFFSGEPRFPAGESFRIIVAALPSSCASTRP